MVYAQQTTRWFPYVGAAGWLTKLHQLCIRSMPPRVDVDWLTSADRIGLSRSNASQLLSFMQKVGWVGSDGAVTDEGKKLRLVGEPWQQAAQEMVERLYPDLLEQIRAEREFSPQAAEEFFVAATSMGHSGRQQMIAVFRWFVREAALTEVEQRVWGDTRQRGRRSSEVRREPVRSPAPSGRKQDRLRAEQGDERDVAEPHRGPQPDQRLSTIASVLSVSIDGTWEEDRMAAVFGMLEKLLKGEPVNG